MCTQYGVYTVSLLTVLAMRLILTPALGHYSRNCLPHDCLASQVIHVTLSFSKWDPLIPCVLTFFLINSKTLALAISSLTILFLLIFTCVLHFTVCSKTIKLVWDLFENTFSKTIFEHKFMMFCVTKNYLTIVIFLLYFLCF